MKRRPARVTRLVPLNRCRRCSIYPARADSSLCVTCYKTPIFVPDTEWVQ